MSDAHAPDGEHEGRAPASRADKREVVLRVLAERTASGPPLSDRAIAKQCGVSQPFVSKLRRSLTPLAGQEEDTVSVPDNDAKDAPDETGLDADLAESAGDGLLDTGRDAHARLIAESVQGTTLLTGGGPEVPGDASDARPSVSRPTFLDLMGIKLSSSHVEEPAPPARAETRIVTDAPVFQVEESEPPITVVTRPAPRAAPDTRTLQEQTYADSLNALRTRLQREQLQHGRLVEKVARGDATEAELAQSRQKMRETKDALEDAATLLEHARVVACERAERTSAIRYHETIDRTASELSELVTTASEMDRLLIELGAARERYHALLEGSLVDLRGRASKLGGQRRALEALTSVTSQGEGPGLEYLLQFRLRAVGVLRTQGGIVGQAPPVDRLAVWAEEWTRQAIEVARAHAPAIPDPETDAAEDTDAPSA